MPLAMLVLQVDRFHRGGPAKMGVRFYRQQAAERTLLFECEVIWSSSGTTSTLREVVRYLQIGTNDGVGSPVRAVHDLHMLTEQERWLYAHLAKTLEDNIDRIVRGLSDANLFTHTCGPMPEFDEVVEPAPSPASTVAQALRQTVRAAGHHADGTLRDLLIAAQEVIEVLAKKIAEREETIAKQQREANADLNALSLIESALPHKPEGPLSSAEIARRAVDAMNESSAYQRGRELEAARDEIVRLEAALEAAQGAASTKAPAWFQDGPFDFKLMRYEWRPVVIAKIRTVPQGISWETCGAGLAISGDVPGDAPEALDLAKHLAEVAAGVRS